MTSGRVAVLLYDGCTIAEVLEPATRLDRLGADIIWVSPEGSPVVDASGLLTNPSLGLAALDAPALDALLIPGGDPGAIVDDAMVQRFILDCAAGGGVVAGICGGVLPLAAAGVLRGRRATHNYRPPWAPQQVADFVQPLFDGVCVEDDPAVGHIVDGKVITALPNAAAAFSIAVAESLNFYEGMETGLLVRHLQGEYVPSLFSDTDTRAGHE